MKQQRMALYLGVVLSAGHFFLFCEGMVNPPAKLEDLVDKRAGKRAKQVLQPRPEVEADGASDHGDSNKRARTGQDLLPEHHPSSQTFPPKKNKPWSIVRDKFWATPYLRPPTMMFRPMILEPIRTPTEHQVSSCRSPLAFDLARTTEDFELEPNSFTGLSIHELFKFYGYQFKTDVSERARRLDLIFATKSQAFRQTKYTGLQKQFSPLLSYISVQFSRRMRPWLDYFWGQIGTTFSNRGWMGIESHVDMTLFLPFIYQILLQKPTLKQWFVIENLCAAFMAYWKVQLLYHTLDSCLVDEFITSQILEKKAKALMWISEVFSNMLHPGFLELVIKEKAELVDANKDKKHRPPGARKMSTIGRLFQYVAGLSAATDTNAQRKRVASSDDVVRKRQIFSELLKLWQEDCHHGFPVRAGRANQRGTILPLIAGQRKKLEIHDGRFWENWSSASNDISLQSQRFERELESPSPEFQNMNKIRVGARLFGSELGEEARKKLVGFKSAGLNQLNEQCTNLMESILNLIPKSFINPSGEYYSPEVFDYYLQYEKFHSEVPLYFPDKLKTFFNLDESLGRFQTSFWSDFARHRVIRLTKLARTRQRKEINKKANIEDHNPQQSD